MTWLIWELCRTQKRHLALFQAYVFGAYVVVVRIVYGFITNPFVPNRESDINRYTGIADNPNFVATVVAVGLAIAWYLAMKYGRGLRYWLCLAYLPIAIVSLGLLASRSGLLIALVSLSLIPLTYGYLAQCVKLSLLFFWALWPWWLSTRFLRATWSAYPLPPKRSRQVT